MKPSPIFKINEDKLNREGHRFANVMVMDRQGRLSISLVRNLYCEGMRKGDLLFVVMEWVRLSLVLSTRLK